MGSGKEISKDLLRFASKPRHLDKNTPSLFARLAMAALTDHSASPSDRSAIDALVSAQSRRRSTVGPWLLLLLLWGLTTSLLILGAETATLIAAGS